MKSLFTTLLLSATFLSGGLFLSSCANTGSGGAAVDGTFRPAAPVSHVEATDQMRRDFRAWR